MIGHISILNLRLRGFKPKVCFIHVCDEQQRYIYGWDHPDQAMFDGNHPFIDINPDDTVATLDLRVLRDIGVHVIGHLDNQERTRAVFDRAVSFNPAYAIAVIGDSFLQYSPSLGLIVLNAQQGAEV